MGLEHSLPHSARADGVQGSDDHTLEATMTVTIRLRVVLYAAAAAIFGAALMYVALDAVRVDAAPGDTDTTYIPTAGCRLADTRLGTDNVGQHSGPLGSAGIYEFQVTGTNGDCTGPLAIPADATGVALNVTAVAPTTNSNMRVYPANLTQVPLLSNLNVTAGASPTPNKVDVSLSTGGAIKVYNQQGNVHIVIDLLGYYTKSSLTEIDDRLTTLETATPTEPNLTAITDRLDTLETQVADLQTENTSLRSDLTSVEADNAALESRVSDLETDVGGLQAKLANVSVEEDAAGHPTVRFSGVNLQIVDGTGDTQCNTSGFELCNGLGNLIIGYNEDPGDDARRIGTHNLALGFDNDYTGFSGIVAGTRNSISAAYASVTGGEDNSARGFASSVSGGDGNTAGAHFSSVSGGRFNTASGVASSVSGGRDNTASGGYSSVSGGGTNDASGLRSSVSGGQSNTASASAASVSGGAANTASANVASVSGGTDNVASATWASVSGGRLNIANADNASVSGGLLNSAIGTYATVSGGRDNEASGESSTVSGGLSGSVAGNHDWLAGALFEED